MIIAAIVVFGGDPVMVGVVAVGAAAVAAAVVAAVVAVVAVGVVTRAAFVSILSAVVIVGVARCRSEVTIVVEIAVSGDIALTGVHTVGTAAVVNAAVAAAIAVGASSFGPVILNCVAFANGASQWSSLNVLLLVAGAVVVVTVAVAAAAAENFLWTVGYGCLYGCRYRGRSVVVRC